ncbi:MAG: hypothetical protein GF364_11075 [Candidatus Lokiarchaeota archaeon]|nr:hypothetical protein [Candidatus Lokiarchaeota archaeon]
MVVGTIIYQFEIDQDEEGDIIPNFSKIAQKETKGKSILEVAGIGSEIEEHIKMLVPILEESWMNSHKNYEKNSKT